MSDRRKNSGRANSALISVILIIVMILAAGLLVAARYRTMQNEKSAPASIEPPAPSEEPLPTPAAPTPEPTMSPEEIKAMEAEAAARKAEAAKYSFYQKLEKGYAANILILGDASAMDTESDAKNGIVDGPKFRALSEKLQEKYPPSMGGTFSVNNLANVNGNLLCDALRVNEMPEEPSYDLAILSYGINDQKNDVATNYEALIAALHKKFPDCSIICTIEPCFHAITPDLDTMIKISDTYEIPVINLFSIFYEKGIDTYFDYFEANQTLLNEKGTAEWINCICEIIDANVKASAGKMPDMPVITKKAGDIAELRFVPVTDPRVSRKDDTSYTVELKVEGLAYILHEKMIGKDDAKVIADGILYSFGKLTGTATPMGEYIVPVYDDLRCEKEAFTITFTNKELADGLKGFYLTEKFKKEK